MRLSMYLVLYVYWVNDRKPRVLLLERALLLKAILG